MSLVVAACATATVLQGVLFERFRPEAAVRVALVWLAVFGIIVSFSVWVARRLGLPHLLFLAPLSGGHRWRRFVAWGVVPGLAISLVNALLYRVAGGAGPLPWWSEGVDGHLDVVVVSATAAAQEETLYRLFAVSFLVAMGMRFRGWRPRFRILGEESVDPPAVPGWMIAGAVVVAAILFGLRHPDGEIRATLFGLLLGWIFLRAGWESAVTAHFLGNYLLFASIYL